MEYKIYLFLVSICRRIHDDKANVTAVNGDNVSKEILIAEHECRGKQNEQTHWMEHLGNNISQNIDQKVSGRKHDSRVICNLKYIITVRNKKEEGILSRRKI